MTTKERRIEQLTELLEEAIAVGREALGLLGPGLEPVVDLDERLGRLELYTELNLDEPDQLVDLACSFCGNKVQVSSQSHRQNGTPVAIWCTRCDAATPHEKVGDSSKVVSERRVSEIAIFRDSLKSDEAEMKINAFLRANAQADPNFELRGLVPVRGGEALAVLYTRSLVAKD